MRIKTLFKSNIVKNGAWLFVLQFANTVLPLITIPFVTRILGAAGFGQFSTAYNWATYCQVIVEYGFTLNGARKIATSDSSAEDNHLARAIIGARAFLFLLCFVLVNIICLLFTDLTQHRNTLIMMTIVFSVVFQMNWLFQGKQQMQYITIVNVIARLLSVALILILVKTESDVALYCVLYSITFLLSSLLGFLIARGRFEIRLGIATKQEIIQELKDGWPLFTSAAISRVFGSIGITVLGIFATNAIVGMYSAVYKIPYILNLCFAPISQALFPHMSQQYAINREQAKKLNQKLVCIFGGMFIVACTIVIFLRLPLVRTLFGEEYVGYANLVFLMAPQVVLGVINNFLGVQSLVAAGQSRDYSTCVLLNAVLLLACNFVLCPIFGAYGTALASLIAEMVLTLVLVHYNRKQGLLT